MSQTPIISVVVPTRDRADTLVACLRALRRHRSKAIEIVVQDNFSGPETLAVVRAAQKNDPRIKYSRAPHPTSQRHNFELGLAAATGQYMSIIGDDDGYCLGSLDWLAKQLPLEPVDAVRWNLIQYCWPSLSADNEGFMYVYATKSFGGWSYEEGKSIADKTIVAGTGGSWENILVYHGMISRVLYDRIRAKTKGQFFSYPLPDVYAHNLMSFSCSRFLDVRENISIYGTSGHSAGSSWSRETAKSNDASAAGQRWISESIADPVAAEVDWQPDIRTLRYHDFASLKLGEKYGLIGDHRVDQEIWTQAIINEISQQPWQYGPWATASEKAPYDAEIFRAVRKKFGHLSRNLPAAPSSRYKPEPDEVILRVRNIGDNLTDDIEGAMLAHEELMNDGSPLFIQPQNKNLTARMNAKTAHLLGRLIVKMPVFSYKLMRHPLMPNVLRRALKRLRWAQTPRSLALNQRLALSKARINARRSADPHPAAQL